jgi:hypothetical protein
MTIAFLMCTEGGQLEQESLLMAESFRKFTGSFQTAPLYSFQIRDKNDVSIETIKALEAFNVEHRKVVLNQKYPDYPLANKPLLCAYAEQEIDADILVFLDSDLVFFSEPKEFLLPSDYEVGIRPEHHKMIGSEGPHDPNDTYWSRLYNLSGMQADDHEKVPFVTTTVDQKRIKAFWNSGVVAVRRQAGVFTAWKETIEKLLVEGTTINQENFYYEQSALSATICALKKRVWNFSPGYNYPIHSHNEMPASERLGCLEDIVCVHDHFFRNRREWYRERIWVKTLMRLKEFDKRSPKYEWLYNYLQTHTSNPNFSQSALEFALSIPVVQEVLAAKR